MAGLVTGGTMEWPLLAQADLIVGLGVARPGAAAAPVQPSYFRVRGLARHRTRAGGPGGALVHQRDRPQVARRGLADQPGRHLAGPAPPTVSTTLATGQPSAPWSSR